MILKSSLIIGTILIGLTSSVENWRWSWTCIRNKCVRNSNPTNRALSMGDSTQNICKLSCGPQGSLWPKPTGTTNLANQIIDFHPSKIHFDYSKVEGARTTKEYLQRVSKIFQSNLLADCGDDCNHSNTEVTIHFAVTSPELKLNWNTSESYSLDINTTHGKDAKVEVKIRSKTVYGARHALETLSQLTTTYAPQNTVKALNKVFLVMVSSARITDSPVYPHRGLLLDTARNFISVSTIKRTLDAMAMTKLNVLHWHVTDSQSFPLEIPRVPQMTKYGAYSHDKIYTKHDTLSIIEYARLRGIRVIIEIDAPAHAGNGWQWGEHYNIGTLAVCVNQQPWRKYCIQPPCGQLNPVNPELYRLLGDVYKDIIDMTPPGEVFHMGGDEVHFPCWNSSSEITSWMKANKLPRTERGFLDLWGTFQEKALQVFDKVNPVPNTPIMLWSSHLTQANNIERYLDKKRYIIETWVEEKSSVPRMLLDKGYKLVMATKDKWYLDHGFGGNNAYHSWKTAWANKLPYHENVLGGETAMWSEMVDDHSLDAKVWPRAAAVGERLWSDPKTKYSEAEPRLQQFRQRLVKKGINADALSPFYCYQNEEECF